MKMVLQRTVVAVALTFVVASCDRHVSKNQARWVVPEKPDPQTILSEAKDDADAGRYENALAKQVWFHENALKIDRSFYGVRLSFALSDWIDLGKSYPPALEKLKSIRDEDDKKIRGDQFSRNLFHDFESINEHLGEEERTRDTFSWLDTNAPNSAKQAFDLAEPSLVKAKKYQLCGKYLDPDLSFQRMFSFYKELAEDPKSKKDSVDFARKDFSHDSATLVALLVLNARKEEADHIAIEAGKVWSDSNSKALLEKAKKGEVPEPWP
jgi:hypothetical protein